MPILCKTRAVGQIAPGTWLIWGNLPRDVKYQHIVDRSKWKLKAPGRGNRYIVVGDQVLEVTKDLATVVVAVGIVNELLNWRTIWQPKGP